MADGSRWRQAQSYEKSYWESEAKKIEKDKLRGLSWYQWRSDNLMSMIAKAFPSNPPSLVNASVLEIGSGPVGLIAFLEASTRIAIDPLCEFYSTQPALVEYRNPDVKYENVKGEHIPYEDESFDMIIIENVIDHVENAGGVMEEIFRLLKPGGVLYLTVNLHPPWGAFLHRIVSKLRIDGGHPHTFTLNSISGFLNKYRFDIFYDEWEIIRNPVAETPNLHL